MLFCIALFNLSVRNSFLARFFYKVQRFVLSYLYSGLSSSYNILSGKEFKIELIGLLECFNFAALN